MTIVEAFQQWPIWVLWHAAVFFALGGANVVLLLIYRQQLESYRKMWMPHIFKSRIELTDEHAEVLANTPTEDTPTVVSDWAEARMADHCLAQGLGLKDARETAEEAQRLMKHGYNEDRALQRAIDEYQRRRGR